MYRLFICILIGFCCKFMLLFCKYMCIYRYSSIHLYVCVKCIHFMQNKLIDNNKKQRGLQNYLLWTQREVNNTSRRRCQLLWKNRRQQRCCVLFSCRSFWVTITCFWFEREVFNVCEKLLGNTNCQMLNKCKKDKLRQQIKSPCQCFRRKSDWRE